MSTSGVYPYYVTRDDIVRQALLNIKKLDPFESPDAMQMQDCTMVLNMLAKQWQGNADFGMGLKVWTRKRGNLFLSDSTNQYTLGPNGSGWALSYYSTTTTAAATAAATVINLTSVSSMVAADHIGIVQTDGSIYWTTVTSIATLAVTVPSVGSVGVASGATVYYYTTPAPMPVLIETVVLRDEDDSDTPIRIMRTVQDYDMLPTKTQVENQSDPIAIFYESGLTDGTLYTDCGSCSDLTKRLIITYMSQVQNFENPLDTPYYPAEYYLALVWQLSKLIAPQFGAIWTPAMEDNYKMATAIAKGKDAEVCTLYFQPGEE